MSVTAAKGFKASGVAARISKLGPDLVCPEDASRYRETSDGRLEPA